MHFFSENVGRRNTCKPKTLPSIPSCLIHITLLLYRQPWSMTNVANLCASKILTPPLFSTYELIQLHYPGAASNIQLAQPNISLYPR